MYTQHISCTSDGADLTRATVVNQPAPLAGIDNGHTIDNMSEFVCWLIKCLPPIILRSFVIKVCFVCKHLQFNVHPFKQTPGAVQG